MRNTCLKQLTDLFGRYDYKNEPANSIEFVWKISKGENYMSRLIHIGFVNVSGYEGYILADIAIMESNNWLIFINSDSIVAIRKED